MKRFLQAAFVCAALSFAVIGCEKKEEPKVEPAPVPEAPAPEPPAPMPTVDSTAIKDSIAKADAAKKEAEAKAAAEKKGTKKAAKAGTEVKKGTDGSAQKLPNRDEEIPKVEENQRSERGKERRS